MRTLLWKEWHENWWKLAFGSLILAAFAVIGLRARIVSDGILLEWVSVLSVLLLPVLASTGLVPAERADGTLDSLLALPIKPRSIFIAKTIMGILLCAVPILVAGAASVAVAGDREMSSGSICLVFLATLAVSLSLFFWMFALTVRLPTETRAALIAMGILVSWLIASAGMTRSAHPDGASRFWFVNPFVFIFGFQDGTPAVSLFLATIVQLIVALALWFWASRQIAIYGEGQS